MFFYIRTSVLFLFLIIYNIYIYRYLFLNGKENNFYINGSVINKSIYENEKFNEHLKNIRRDNEDILNQLQEENEAFLETFNKIYLNERNISDKKIKDKDSLWKNLRKYKNQYFKRNNLSNENKFVELQGTSTLNKKPCSGDVEKCIKLTITNAEEMMNEINKDLAPKKKKKKKEKSKETRDLNNADHTMYIYDNSKKKDLYKKYKKKKKNGLKAIIVDGAEYLGVGYDILFGNPIGDPFLKVDAGYRDSVIKLTYPKTDDDLPDNYQNINPNGAYIRNEISCNRFEQQEEISSMSDYKKELSVDAKVKVSYLFFASFSASTGYKEASRSLQNNNSKMFMLKTYCFHYVASLSSYGQWTLSDQFKRAITLLPAYFNSAEHDGTVCTPDDLKVVEHSHRCGKSVSAWLDFFKNFGTHFSTVLHLGGKITQTLKISNSESKSMSSKSLDVSVGGGGGIGGFKSTVSTDTSKDTSEKKSSSNSNMEKETIVIGGTAIYDPNNPKNFEKWAKSVKNNAMPIKGEYEAFSKILPNELIEPYDDALFFYVTLYATEGGSATTSLNLKNVKVKEMIINSSFVSTSGFGLKELKCESNKKLILGFSLSVSQNLSNPEYFNLIPCDFENNSCISETNNEEIYNYLFGICSDDNIPFLEQRIISKNNETTAECPHKEQIILFGFVFILVSDKKKPMVLVESCTFGKSSCSFNNNVINKHVSIYLVCGHKDFSNSQFTTVTKRLYHKNLKEHNPEKIHICPEKVIFNMLMEFPTESFSSLKNSCMSINTHCPENFERCSKSNKDSKFFYHSITVY